MDTYIAELEAETHVLRQRAIRAHQICNLMRVHYPEIGELADDGCLHEAIHDILRVDHSQRPEPVGLDKVWVFFGIGARVTFSNEGEAYEHAACYGGRVVRYVRAEQ